MPHHRMPVAANKEFKVHGNDARAPGVPFGEGWLQMEVSMPVVPGPEDDVGQGGKHILPAARHVVVITFIAPGVFVWAQKYKK